MSLLDRALPKDVLGAYLRLWAKLVVRAKRPFIIGVTGSVGKTTTTEMLACVLEAPGARDVLGEIRHSENNMNDDIGLPATLLLFNDLLEDYPPSRLRTAWLAPWRAAGIAVGIVHYPAGFVLEYGAGWGGHIAKLAELAPPNIAVVTAVGPAHLERLGTVAGVAQEKIALVQAVPASGLAVLGAENPFLTQFVSAAACPTITLSGRGQALSENIACAICNYLQIPEGVMRAALRDFAPPKGRMVTHRLHGMTIIDDSYNANPLSMKFGLDELSRLASNGERRVAILGHMGELGGESRRYHEEIGRCARSCADLVIGIGSPTKDYGPDMWFDASEACADEIAKVVQEHDIILVKGSSSSRTKRIVEALRELPREKARSLDGVGLATSA